MKFISTIIKEIIFDKISKPLGRWSLDYCNKKVKNKVELSNEDHCGVCGQYALSKIKLKNIGNTNKLVEK